MLCHRASEDIHTIQHTNLRTIPLKHLLQERILCMEQVLPQQLL